MKIKIFGKLTDLFGGKVYDLPSENITSVSDLKSKLVEKLPELAQTNYLVVVNGVKAENSTLLFETSEIALLPPYSGG
ncbi:MoaD/ThiS family protein [Chryseobacterium aurantiacum]|uniref:MoaD/ThiS family protein n=1 Tax=Chryseobacterium aurantiacum TaxID=2116499 RepID=UPI000D1269A2|nr:MoaD/ThiS family protein [Chryseobacterium aurantiacum]